MHEIKFDGYRTQAHLRQGQPAIYTRRAHDWTKRFQTIADALAALPAKDLILDGEAVVADSRGIPDFGLLHADLAVGRKDRLLYYAFDLLYLDGFDLRRRGLPRKRLLAEVLAGASDRILYAEHLEGDGAEIHERACAIGLKESSANSRTPLDRSGRVENWIKLKCGKSNAFAKRVAQRLAATAPDRYTLSSAPGKRGGRIFIDYLRNGRGTTAIGAWSPRVRAGFPIAAPVSWREVEKGIRPDAFTMEKPPRR